MDTLINKPKISAGSERRRFWLAYAGICLVSWLLFVLAGTDYKKGAWEVWSAVYEASLTLWAPMLLGVAVLPWVRHLHRAQRGLLALLGLHALAALLFSALWLAADFVLASLLFGPEHAHAMLMQAALWRGISGVFVYVPLATGFTAVLSSAQARASALAAAQAESALARAELAAISGKLNPHFLFNTLNSLIALTRKDAKAAESALMHFSDMLRYVLDSKRDAADRVCLREELDFVRDYLALESLRLGARLRQTWDIDPATLDDDIPPLTLQPLVENCIVHGIAPKVGGGTISISARRDALTHGLALTVQDDGAGCELALLHPSPADSPRQGIGLGALRRRFALDYEGRARLQTHTAPGAGFRVDIWIPPI
ncbi:sensor histidine kinase [Roseateles albus]|uniref:Histidine kinase n=1 Tax=Roseateles albus TaxID=2987525 RepID=A0ABT5K8H5_9BURK|nr:histidine kinase [Roseateles albus]MDC8770193.1 histidine kinase [Roseateles albus]